jgi:hypothetical protein
MKTINTLTQKTNTISIILLIFLYNLSGFAAGWYEVFNINQTQSFNKIASVDIQAKEVYAVGENGAFAFSKDGGLSWNSMMTPTANHLYDIAVTYFPDTILIAVGEAGTVLRSSDKGQSWQENNLGPDNLYAVAFDGLRLWIGGDNRDFVISSPDMGLTWETSAITDGIMSVTTIIPNMYGVHAAAVQGNTTIILEYDGGQNDFDSIDMIPDFAIKSSFEGFSNLYFAGYDIGSSQAGIVLKNDQGGVWGPAMPFNPAGIDVEINAISGLMDSPERLWIATTGGTIYESDASASNFFPVYQNIDGKEIQTIAAAPLGALERVAWAGGTQGLMLKYDFGVMFTNPPPNGIMPAAQNNIEIRFTSKPALNTIKNGIYIHGSVQGVIPFMPSYVDIDSNMVNLNFNEGSVPGEKLTIIVTDFIFEEDGTTNINGFSYEINVIPFGPTDFSFNPPLTVQKIDESTTNYVTGFFNDDDSFDLISFASDTLYCFSGDGIGGFLAPHKIALGPIISISSSLDQQLKTVDLNLDGLLDLVLFDDDIIYKLINNSDFSFNFTVGDFYSTNVSDLEFISADNDSTIDFVILNDSLKVQTGVDENTFGSSFAEDDESQWINFTVGDIDADGFQDFAAVNDLNEIVLRHSIPMGGFDLEYPIPGSFSDVKLADLNMDGFLDVLAMDSNNDQIHIFKYFPFWSFGAEAPLMQIDPNNIESFDVYDYNGDDFMDVIMATTAQEIKIYENTGGAGFNELPDKQHFVDIDPDGLLHGDFDKDGLLDLVAFDMSAGNFQVILKTGGPLSAIFFDTVEVQNGQVYLSWYDSDLTGEVSFYRIYRDIIPGTTNFLVDVDTKFYNDNTVLPGQRYWYKVEAFDISANSLGISNEIDVEVMPELAGPISGVLADVGATYLVTAPIEVSEGSTLQIMPGVELEFANGADFRVYGELEVMGSEHQTVEFKANDDQMTWPGILISGLVNTDTVRLSWFDIHHAEQAIRIENRPVQVQYGAFTENGVAIDINFSGGSFDARNIILYGNDVGLHARSGSRINLSNMTLVQNKTNGMIIENPSSVKIKNSIIWDNNFEFGKGPDIKSTSLSSTEIKYCTVDSLEGNFLLDHISKIPPTFQSILEDTLSFFPDTLSPTIDAGDPADNFSLEPLPNGGRINQGVYGGTPYAMPTFQPKIAINTDTLKFAAAIGDVDSKSFQITNYGTVDLDVNELKLNGPEFYYDVTLPQILPAGETANIDINFTPNLRTTITDRLYIINNDPHFPDPGVPLVLEGTGLNRPPSSETGLPDTLIYTYVPFNYRFQVADLDGDELDFSDDSPLFDIGPLSGNINFTPTVNDTGTFDIIITVNDGFVTISDTFNLTIALNPVNAAQTLTITPGDQLLTLNWTNPDNQFYSGTNVSMSKENAIDGVDSATTILDTSLAKNSPVQYTIKNLEIGETYFISIFNYFDPDIRIYSTVLQASATTLVPNVVFDFSDQRLFVPPEDTLLSSLKVKNEGGGTLNIRFSYAANPLLDSWFQMDTTDIWIAPFDSGDVSFMLYPSELMNDIDHSVNVKLETNQPGWITRDKRLVMKILFDRSAPAVTMLAAPDSVHKYAAARFKFTANDTVDTLGWLIGDATKDLRIRYRFLKINSLTDYEILRQESDLSVAPLDFYPLEDGLYRFDLWIYDRQGNGFSEDALAYQKHVLVVGSTALLTQYRWYLASIPRDRTLPLSQFFIDSGSVIFRWDNKQMKYISYADSTLSAGQGVWILTFKPKWIDIRKHTMTRDIDSTVVQLDAGWNQIGVPSGYPLHFAKIRFMQRSNETVLSIGEAIEQQLISPAVYWYRSSYLFPGYEWGILDSTIAYPWRGYWVYTPEGGSLIYSYEPAFPEKKISDTRTDNVSVLNKITRTDWQLSLTLKNDKYSDAGNILGIANAKETLPIFEPPHLREHCAAYFISPLGKLTRDLRKPFENLCEVKEWDLKISTSRPGKIHEVSWSLWSEESGVYIYLVDKESEKVINLSEQDRYEFSTNSKYIQFTIYATQDANFTPKIIPATFKLAQNYPNPFNPFTTIKFGVPAEAEGQQISLKIYNILGQEIITLLEKTQMSAGYHEVMWDGLNTERKRVASGIYFYRLVGAKQHLVRKMVMLK